MEPLGRAALFEWEWARKKLTRGDAILEGVLGANVVLGFGWAAVVSGDVDVKVVRSLFMRWYDGYDGHVGVGEAGTEKGFWEWLGRQPCPMLGAGWLRDGGVGVLCHRLRSFVGAGLPSLLVLTGC